MKIHSLLLPLMMMAKDEEVSVIVVVTQESVHGRLMLLGCPAS